MNLFDWLRGKEESAFTVETAKGAVWYSVERGTWRTAIEKNTLPRRNEIGFAETVWTGQETGSSDRHWWQFWRTGSDTGGVIHMQDAGRSRARATYVVEPRPYQGRPDPLPWPGSVGTGEGPTAGGRNPHTQRPYIPWPGEGDPRRR